MVEFVWHTLVNGRVRKDINVVTDLNGHKVLGKGDDGTMIAEFLGEHVTGTCAETIGVRHGGKLIYFDKGGRGCRESRVNSKVSKYNVYELNL